MKRHTYVDAKTGVPFPQIYIESEAPDNALKRHSLLMVLRHYYYSFETKEFLDSIEGYRQAKSGRNVKQVRCLDTKSRREIDPKGVEFLCGIGVGLKLLDEKKNKNPKQKNEEIFSESNEMELDLAVSLIEEQPLMQMAPLFEYSEDFVMKEAQEAAALLSSQGSLFFGYNLDFRSKDYLFSNLNRDDLVVHHDELPFEYDEYAEELCNPKHRF